MRYVYLLQSEAFVCERYLGVRYDLRQRLADHNAGKSPHTPKYAPRRALRPPLRLGVA
jgi:putative endonuclease